MSSRKEIIMQALTTAGVEVEGNKFDFNDHEAGQIAAVIEAALDAARPEPAGDDLEDLQARIVSSIRGRDGEAGAGSDAHVGEQFGSYGEWLEINGNLDVQHLAGDLLQDGYGQGVPKLHDAWEAGANAMTAYMGNQHLGIDPPANPYDRYEDGK